MEAALANGDYAPPQIRPEIGVFLLLCVKAPALGALFPGHFFLEVRTGDKWADPWCHDNDESVMRTRFEYGYEQLRPGQGIRLRSWRGDILLEKST